MLVLERFEGQLALIEDGDKHFTVDRQRLASDIREGDVLKFDGTGYLRDDDETNKRRSRILRLQEGLWK